MHWYFEETVVAKNEVDHDDVTGAFVTCGWFKSNEFQKYWSGQSISRKLPKWEEHFMHHQFSRYLLGFWPSQRWKVSIYKWASLSWFGFDMQYFGMHGKIFAIAREPENWQRDEKSLVDHWWKIKEFFDLASLGGHSKID